METNLLGLSEAEISDWNQRRQEKKINDRKREEEEKEERARQEQMRRNAEEAEQRRRQEESNGKSRENGTFIQRTAATAVDGSRQVQFDERNNSETRLSVAIAENGTQIPVDFITDSGRDLRCMVVCCAKRLEGESNIHGHLWCARCSRLVCMDCLTFQVTNVRDTSPGNLHRVCVDCMTQLVDVMETAEDVRLRQRRVYILRLLEAHLARFSNRAAYLQEQVVQHEAKTTHEPRVVDMHRRLRALKKRLADLQKQEARATARTAAAKSDDNAVNSGGIDTETEIQRLTAECEALEQELIQQTEGCPGDNADEEEVVAYLARITDTSDRLENANTSLAIAMSNTTEEASNSLTEAAENTFSLAALEEEVVRLTASFEKLAADNEDTLEHTLELSGVQAALEDAQIRLVTVQSMATDEDNFQYQRPSLLYTDHFAVSAQGRLLESQTTTSRRTGLLRLLGSRKHDQKFQDWVSSIFRVKDRLADAETARERMRFASELLHLMEETHDFIDSDWDELGLEAAQKELNEILSDGQKEGLGPTDPRGSFDVFSDEMFDLLSPNVGGPGSGSDAADDTEDAISDLAAIGESIDEWPLPMNLQYPTARMLRQLEVLRNTLELRKVESERAAEEIWAQRFQLLDTRQEELDNSISKAQRRATDAEASAEEEERRQQERAEERRQRELARLERERVLREKAERAERERQELLRRHEQEEAATQSAFSSAAGENNNGAASFGGSGDLRMCKRCKAGPFENQACSNLGSHNDTSTSYKGNTVQSTANPNHCPHCGWFHSDWHQWPYWDGVHGPH